MNVTDRISPKHLASGAASVVLALAIAAPAMASSVPAAPAAAPADAATAVLCDTQWIAVKQSRSVKTVKAAGDCEVSRRLTTIASLKSRVASTKALTSSDRNGLNTLLDGSHDGLVAQKAKIDGDTTLAAATADVHAVFTASRVYVLVARQVALVSGDDIVSAAAGQLTTVAGDISSAIAAGQAAGKDESAAAGHLAAMQSAIGAADDAVAGQAAKVLPLTPAQWNAGSATPVLNADRGALVSARDDLARAVAEARAAVASLK